MALTIPQYTKLSTNIFYNFELKNDKITYFMPIIS